MLNVYEVILILRFGKLNLSATSKPIRTLQTIASLTKLSRTFILQVCVHHLLPTLSTKFSSLID